MLNPIYQVHSERSGVNNHISKTGLRRLYQNLLARKKIEIDGPAHRRLKKLMNEEEWWDKL